MRFRFVDDLRGIAALAVAVGHLIWVLPEGFDVFETGRFGVDVFFVISGFVMAYSLGEATISGSFIGRFLLRRSIRLDPPYWMMLGLHLLAIALWADPFPPLRHLPLNLLYLQELTVQQSILIPAWTLALEIQFYLLLVLLLGVRQAVRRRTSLAWPWPEAIAFGPPAAISIAFGVSDVVYPLIEGAPLIVWHSFVPYWHMFFAGVVAKWCIVDRRSTWWLVSYVGLVTVAALAAYEPDLFPDDDQSPIFACLVAITLVLAGRGTLLADGLGHRVIAFLGTISYSLYLTHWAVGVNLVRLLESRLGADPISALGGFAIALAASIAAAVVLHRMVEVPAQTLSRRVGASPPRPQGQGEGISNSSRQTVGSGRRSGHGDDAARPGWRR